jgi:hypothetical protein
MTVAGIDLTIAIWLIAAIGDMSRFSSPEKLVSHFGLNPRVRQSGDGHAHHGRISKIGQAHACGLMVEAAWAAAVAPSPLRSFFTRIKRKRGKPIAAVATARKITVIFWHLLSKNEDYAFGRPALLQAKIRQMEIKAGLRSKRGGNTPGGRATTTSRRSDTASARSLLRRKRPTVASSQLGASGRRAALGAQAPHRRGDADRLRDRVCVLRSLLFAARSPARQPAISKARPRRACQRARSRQD